MTHPNHLKYGAISFFMMLAIVCATGIAMKTMETTTSHIASQE